MWMQAKPKPLNNRYIIEKRSILYGYILFPLLHARTNRVEKSQTQLIALDVAKHK